jgi:hypothetical protein
VSHPAGLPDLFLDRSLGRIKVPQLLRAAGLQLVTLGEHYGIPADENVRDEEWLALVAQQGWVALHKDPSIRRNVAERRAIVEHGTRTFSLTRQDLLADEMARRFLDNLEAITEACSEPGPFVYAVHGNRIEPLDLPPLP